jgi:2,4-dienoyl-CoA reductase-like NADH-dependent reductase (Old Yellow Enzyme family)
MSTTTLRHLTSPGQIGAMRLRNRMVVTAMGVGFSHLDGTVSERQIAYHAERRRAASDWSSRA